MAELQQEIPQFKQLLAIYSNRKCLTLNVALVNLEFCPKSFLFINKNYSKTSTYLNNNSTFYQPEKQKHFLSSSGLTRFSSEKYAKFTMIQTTLDTMCAKQFSVRSSQCCPVLSSALNSMYMGGKRAQCTPAQVQARLSAHSDSFLRVQFQFSETVF